MEHWTEAKAAFFDVDGTLLPLPSLEVRFVARCWRSLGLSAAALVCFPLRRLGALAAGSGQAKRDKGYLLGARYEALVSAAGDFVNALPENLLHSETVERLRAHRDAGGQCSLLTGTLECLAVPLAERLGISEVHATRLDVQDGRCTGKVIGTHPYGEGKRELFSEICSREGLAPSSCAAYADKVSDTPLLKAVGWPTVVRPGRRLKTVALRHQWEVLG